MKGKIIKISIILFSISKIENYQKYYRSSKTYSHIFFVRITGYHFGTFASSFLLFVNRYTFPVTQLVKNPLTILETPVQFLGQEILLEKG